MHAGPVRERRDVQRHLHLPGTSSVPGPVSDSASPNAGLPVSSARQRRGLGGRGEIVVRSAHLRTGRIALDQLVDGLRRGGYDVRRHRSRQHQEAPLGELVPLPLI